MKINIFIQARMSSKRFPGKVLAPVGHKPLIGCLLERLSSFPKEDLVVLTSVDPTDDPLAFYLENKGYQIFRGDLENVFRRFSKALDQFPCDFFVRLSADSPLIDPSLVRYILNQAASGDYDLISNIFVRKFPKGQSVEAISSSLFKQVKIDGLEDGEKEHVFPYFYKNKDNYRHLFIENKEDMSHINQCIDTIEDLNNLSSNPPFTFDEASVCTVK